MTFNDFGQALVLLIILYAVWQTAGLWLRLPAWFRQDGFIRWRSTQDTTALYLRDPNGDSVLLQRLSNWREDRAQPASCWYGQSGSYACWQYLSGVRRSHSFLRRKSLKRTRYNVTIVHLGKFSHPDLYFCVRPRQSLDSVDYLYAESEFSPQADSDFSRMFFIETNRPEEFEHVLSEPIRQLMLNTEEVSLELINGYLVLVRVTHILDLREHLRTERDTATSLAEYLERK